MAATEFLSRDALQALIDNLRERGYRVIGPQVRDGAIQYLDLDDTAQLPTGQRDAQAPGRYRLTSSGRRRSFDWANGPQALKPWMFTSREVLWRSRREADGRLVFSEDPADPRPLAVIGVRACDLAALALQDRHFLDHIRDPAYAARREGLFCVAVHCNAPATTCFCTSTGDGPMAERGFDLALGELDDGYTLTVGSAAGREIVASLDTVTASAQQLAAVDAELQQAREIQTRRLPSRDLEASLFANLDHPRWSDVGARCLACGNCSSVCPTCFCHAEQDVPALDGNSSEHVREWDSCFTAGHGYLHGYQVRPAIAQRYRQWLTHKLGSWHSQYGRSGCVGCGRCISWCPAGIDITTEATAICGGDA